MKNSINNIIFDVDGVLTDGSFYYDEKGKKYKKFGAHDADALILLKKYFKIYFISSDLRGFKISSKRIRDIYHIFPTLIYWYLYIYILVF